MLNNLVLFGRSPLRGSETSFKSFVEKSANPWIKIKSVQRFFCLLQGQARTTARRSVTVFIEQIFVRKTLFFIKDWDGFQMAMRSLHWQ